MTWDEVYELAKKVTKLDGGVQYRGFDFQDSFQFTANQLSLPVVDAQTNKAVVNNDKWKKLFKNYARFYTIPGNEVDAKANMINRGVEGLIVLSSGQQEHLHHLHTCSVPLVLIDQRLESLKTEITLWVLSRS